MAFAEHLEDFFSADDFAVTFVLGTTTALGILGDPYAEAGEIEGSRPILTCRAADLPSGLSHGTAVTVDGTAYSIVGVKPDGTGIVELALEAAV